MKVYLLGAGPGDPGLITVKAKDILEKADVIVYDALANVSLLSYTKKEAEIIYVGKIADKHALPQDEINALLISKAKEQKCVARLKGGDPYIFGRGGEEAQALLAAHIPFEEVPGISSTVAAPAYAGIPLTHRDLVSQVTFITGHEKPGKENSAINWHSLAQSKGTLVFVMGMKNLPNIAKNLIDAGLSPKTPSALIYRGTTPSQRSLTAALEDLPKRAVNENFTNPSVIVVGNVVSLHNELNWFEQKPLFGRTIVVTRAREQASTLVSLLSEMGANVLECPTIQICPCKDYSELDQAISALSTYTWLIFTSANGVKFFWQRLKKQGLDSRALGSIRCCTIGPATKDALARYGIEADCMPPKFIAESLVEEMLTKTKGKEKILLPRARVARDVIPETLRAQGFHVDVIPCYETKPDTSKKEAVAQALRDKKISCITFASSSTVTNFLQVIPKELVEASDTRLACIGPVTAKTLRNAGLSCHIEAEEYTIPSLVSAIEKYFSHSTN